MKKKTIEAVERHTSDSSSDSDNDYRPNASSLPLVKLRQQFSASSSSSSSASSSASASAKKKDKNERKSKNRDSKNKDKSKQSRPAEVEKESRDPHRGGGGSRLPVVSEWDYRECLRKYSLTKGGAASTSGQPERQKITMTRIGSKENGGVSARTGIHYYGGSFVIPDTEYLSFLSLYSRYVVANLPMREECLAEKQLQTDQAPLVVDLDFRYDVSVTERQHTSENIENLIFLYLEQLREIYDFTAPKGGSVDEMEMRAEAAAGFSMDACRAQTDHGLYKDLASFYVFVMEKPTINRVEDEDDPTRSVTKDGVHLLFGLQVARPVQVALRQAVLEKIEDVWPSGIRTNPWTSVLDAGISKGDVGWQLYGSNKPHCDRYQITQIYKISVDGQDGEFRIAPVPVASFSVLDNFPLLSVRYRGFPGFHPSRHMNAFLQRFSSTAHHLPPSPSSANASIVSGRSGNTTPRHSVASSSVPGPGRLARSSSTSSAVGVAGSSGGSVHSSSSARNARRTIDAALAAGRRKEKNVDNHDNDDDDEMGGGGAGGEGDAMDMMGTMRSSTGLRARVPESSYPIYSTTHLPISDILRCQCQEELDEVMNAILLMLHDHHYDLAELHHYVMALPETYYGSGSYDKWIRVGWALHNTNELMFATWVYFSAQSPTFSFADLPDLYHRWWSRFEKRGGHGITYRSILHWAQQDARQLYDEIRQESLDSFLEQTLVSSIDGLMLDAEDRKQFRGSPNHWAQAKLLKRLGGAYFVCISITKNIWYHFYNHRWVINDGGQALSILISEDLYKLYENKVSTMNAEIGALKAMNAEDPLIRVKKTRMMRATNIMESLLNSEVKKKIMTEARVFFFEKDFIQRLDTNPYLLVFNNGVVDFENKVFRKGYPEDFVSLSTKMDYVPLDEERDYAIMEEIQDFIRKVFPRQELQEYMWSYMASLLIGVPFQQTLHNFYGSGRNGKSVFVLLLQSVMGEYTHSVPLALLTQDRQKIGGHSAEIAELKGIRMGSIVEPSTKDSILEGPMKQITSGKDDVQCRAPYAATTMTFVPQIKLMLCTNVLMRVRARDYGTWRRFRVVPFEAYFTENPVQGDPKQPYQYQVDGDIERKFEGWKPVFMAMLVKRALAFDKYEFPVCAIVEAESQRYCESQNVLAQFLKQAVKKELGKSIVRRHLNTKFREWFEVAYGTKTMPDNKELADAMNDMFGPMQNNNTWSDVTFTESAMQSSSQLHPVAHMDDDFGWENLEAAEEASLRPDSDQDHPPDHDDDDDYTNGGRGGSGRGADFDDLDDLASVQSQVSVATSISRVKVTLKRPPSKKNKVSSSSAPSMPPLPASAFTFSQTSTATTSTVGDESTSRKRKLNAAGSHVQAHLSQSDADLASYIAAHYEPNM